MPFSIPFSMPFSIPFSVLFSMPFSMHFLLLFSIPFSIDIHDLFVGLVSAHRYLGLDKRMRTAVRSNILEAPLSFKDL